MKMKVIVLLLMAAAHAQWVGAQASVDRDYLPPVGTPAVDTSARTQTASQSQPSPATAPPDSTQCPEFCPANYRPVCGTDGVTYTNECTLSLATCTSPAIRRANHGPCVPGVSSDAEAATTPPTTTPPSTPPTTLPTTNPLPPLPFIPIPVPDLPSLQELPPGGIEIRTCGKSCPRVYSPVCGSDGKTHSNICVMEIKSCLSKLRQGPEITVQFSGTCEDVQTAVGSVAAGPVGEGSVSSSDRVGTVGSPPQAPGSSCREECTRIFIPLCGSDGVIYNNLCLLELADCRSREAGGSGVTVAPDSFCDRAAGEEQTLQGASNLPENTPVASTSSCPQNCTRNLAPVCGSNGLTYNNPCLLEVKDCQDKEAGGPGISIVAGGPCDSVVAESDPVGGTVGISGSPPQAPGSSCREECTKIYIPLCGSDGVTHNNLCLLELADCRSREAGGSGVTIIRNGTCGGLLDPDILAEVPIGTSGQGAPDETASSPPQAPGSSCREECTKIYIPLCGSDGITHNNLCILELADCRSREAGGSGVTIAHEGPCVPVSEGAPVPSPGSSCSEKCTRNFHPVCGSDGITYNNLCLLEVQDCQDKEAGGSGVSVVSEGPCGSPETPQPPKEVEVIVTPEPTRAPPSSSPCRRDCTKNLNPVCGSDGNTYDNECVMDVASCESRRAGGKSIYIVTEGSCDPQEKDRAVSCREECVKTYLPVCGSDGKTYNNECLLDVANCMRWAAKEQGIYIVTSGRCEGDQLDPQSTASQQSQVASLPVAQEPSPLLASLGVPSQVSASPSVSFRTSSCPHQCPEEYSPICGTDNLTYNSRCHLETANCRSRSLGGGGITEAFIGPCVAALPRGPVCDQRCDKSLKYVCGSDGETYNNPCLLALADCLNPFGSITYVGDGPCGSSSVTLLEVSSSVEDESSLDDDDFVPAPLGGYLPPF